MPEFRLVQSVRGLTALKCELLENSVAGLYGLTAHPKGKWGLILTENKRGRRFTLAAAPGVIGAFLQAGAVPDIRSIERNASVKLFPLIARGWPADWLEELGAPVPSDPPPVSVVVLARRVNRSHHDLEDCIRMSVRVRINAPGSPRDQTGFTSEQVISRRDIELFMLGVNSVMRAWVPEGVGTPEIEE